MQFDRDIHEQQGVGMGLFLVKQITELNAGTLTINPEPGGGTRVICRIPVPG
jgi:two-component system, sensor histidine kinase and response regulator